MHGCRPGVAHYSCEIDDVMNHEVVDARCAIYPVASRMLDQLKMLLTEVNVPYDEVFELEEIDRDFGQADVAFAIGVNDVTNPAAWINQARRSAAC
jgi:NAD(P) transhydrogenase subunit beta